jgi:ankyrin repeat protein
MKGIRIAIVTAVALASAAVNLHAPLAHAQVAPSQSEIARYSPLLQAAHNNDVRTIVRVIADGVNPNLRDGAGRAAVHIAAYASAYDAIQTLVKGGADIQAMDLQKYDVITIAAVKNDVRMVELAIRIGGDPKAITSPYEGTALIAAAHLGHVEVVKTLIRAGAPLDHINNLHWTALMEAVVLGDGGANHVETVRALVAAGASKSITDRNGLTPLANAKARNYEIMIELLR